MGYSSPHTRFKPEERRNDLSLMAVGRGGVLLLDSLLPIKRWFSPLQLSFPPLVFFVLHLRGIVVYPWLCRFLYSFIDQTQMCFTFLNGTFEHQVFDFWTSNKKIIQTENDFILKRKVQWFCHNDRMSSKIISQSHNHFGDYIFTAKHHANHRAQIAAGRSYKTIFLPHCPIN